MKLLPAAASKTRATFTTGRRAKALRSLRAGALVALRAGALVALFCGIAAAGLAGPAAAAPFGREPAQDQRPRPDPQGEAQQGVPQRGMRGTNETERDRMSPEQRHQLRRDIQDAGKDIYRPMRQGRGERRRPERR